MVVLFEKESRNAKLSLRQEEILATLSSLCSDLSDEVGEGCVSMGAHFG
jgi:hypothetical protein